MFYYLPISKDKFSRTTLYRFTESCQYISIETLITTIKQCGIRGALVLIVCIFLDHKGEDRRASEHQNRRAANRFIPVTLLLPSLNLQ